MKTYQISMDYELLADLLEAGNTVIWRYPGKRWSQITATHQGKTISYYGNGRKRFIDTCKMQKREFIIPTIETDSETEKKKPTKGK